jgi:rSAM/selenodomain-associated transferase 2
MRLSVIVPMAPGETEWLGLMAQLENVLDADSEIVLVAAGEPVVFPSKWAVQSLGGPAGRAVQMNAGAASARGRHLWFLHADSRLSDAAWPALQRFLARGRHELGWFDLIFRGDGPLPVRLNAWGANIRSRWMKMPFGDQGFVMPAALFTELGGFDTKAAYGEDHLFAWAVRRAGYQVVPVGAPLSTSARKYARHGWARTTLRHLRLTALQAWPQWVALRRGR